jgi:hypothetical protein
MNTPIRRLPTLALLALAACATTPVPDAPADRRGGGRYDVLSVEEIGSNPGMTAFELVQRLRPGWLRTRGASSINNNRPLQVYVDGMPMGDPRALRGIDPGAVRSMRYLSAIEATQQFGTDHTNGAILITTR